MAYEFKKLSDVDVIESMSNNTNVLVEENGEIVKIAADQIVSSSGAGLPEPNHGDMYLVADADRNVKWEEKLAYSEFGHEEELFTWEMDLDFYEYSEDEMDDNGVDGYYYATFGDSYPIDKNNIYIVDINGAKKTMRPKEADKLNFYFCDENDDEFQYEISVQEDEFYIKIIAFTGVRPEGVISIYYMEENIKTLDPKYLPSSVGTVKSVNNVKPDEYGNVKVEISGGASSWNDLQDKPFGATITLTDFLSEQTLTDDYDYSDWPEEYLTTYSHIIEYEDIESKPIIEDNKVYHVYLNDDEYICTGSSYIHYGSDDSSEIMCIGNKKLDDESQEDTGEPFCLSYNASYFNNTIDIKWKIEFDRTITIRVEEEQEEVTQIDSKFLGNAKPFTFNIIRASNAEGENYQCRVDATFKEIKKVYDNKQFMQAYLLSDTGEELIEEGMAYLSHAGDDCFKFEGYRDEKVRVDICSWGDSYEQKIPEYPAPYGSSNAQLITDSDGYSYWEERLAYEGSERIQLFNSRISAIYNSEIGKAVRSFEMYDIEYFDINKEYVINLSEGLFCQNYYLTPSSNTTLEFEASCYPPSEEHDSGKTVNVKIEAEGNNNFSIYVDCDHHSFFDMQIYYYRDVLKTIEPKFIPTVTPVIQSAQVGQTVIVKAVDENGMPTEWEAVDPYVITSATEGSTKKFKITVDDSGALSAIEVTE